MYQVADKTQRKHNIESGLSENMETRGERREKID